jgi:4-aminobutyrate aminotransferase
MTTVDRSVQQESTATGAWLHRDRGVLAGVSARYYDVVAASGVGSWIIDVEGRRFLDFGSGIAVTNVGHCHPRVVAAIQRQAATLLHTSVTVHHTQTVALAERIAGLVPFFEEPQTFFCNSGAEAVDGSLKLARRATGRPGVIAFLGAFHGRTLAATTLTTAKGAYREGYEPLLPSVHLAPYCIPRDFGGDHEVAVRTALQGLDDLLAHVAPASQVGAMIVEPVLGEGGYIPAPVEWLQGLRDRCDAHGILLVFDEVQCGFGRTGRPFAAETFGVTPDVLLFAKGVASGLPLGGIIAPRRLMDRWPPGAHGSTFGGNPVSCAAALATIDVLEEEGLYKRARFLGERCQRRLRQAQTQNPALVVDVRGVGMMIGVEVIDATAAEAVARGCLDRGLIVLTCGPEQNVIRLAPPLNLSDAELEKGLDILTGVLVLQ